MEAVIYKVIIRLVYNAKQLSYSHVRSDGHRGAG